MVFLACSPYIPVYTLLSFLKHSHISTLTLLHCNDLFLCGSQGFINLGPVDIWGWIIIHLKGKYLLCAKCFLHCGIFSSISGLHPVDCCNILSSAVIKKDVSRHCLMSPGVKIILIETAALYNDSFMVRACVLLS